MNITVIWLYIFVSKNRPSWASPLPPVRKGVYGYKEAGHARAGD